MKNNSKKVLGIVLVMMLSLVLVQSASATISLSTETIPDATVGTYYSTQLVASGSGTLVYTRVGKLPTGLSLSGSGLISGTPEKGTAGTYRFAVNVTSSSESVTKIYKLTVQASSSSLTISPTSTYLPEGSVGTYYSTNITASGAGSAVTWSYDWEGGSSNNGGLNFNTTDGTLTGTPNADGTYKLTVTATAGSAKASKTYTVIIHRSGVVPIEITTDELPSAIQGVTYSAKLVSNKSNATWRLEEGTRLPAELTLDGDGTVSGNPTATAGTYSFVVSAYDSANTTSRYKEITIDISSFAITTTELPDGKVQSDYNYVLSSNPSGSVNWSVTDGSLPKGLFLDEEAGLIYGKPEEAGDYAVEITAERNSVKDAAVFSLTINPSSSITPEINDSSLPNAKVGKTYTYTFTANKSGGSWAIYSGVTGNMAINSTTGEFSWTPSSAGPQRFVISYTLGAADGYEMITKEFSITVNDASYTLQITRANPHSGYIRQQYSYQFKANTPGVKWSHDDTKGDKIPNDLVLSESLGTLSGVPMESGTFHIYIIATANDEETAEVDFSLIIASEDYGDDDEGCNTGASIYALMFVAGLFGLKRKH